MADTVLESSILNSIKKLLGLEAEYEAYDADITIFINSAFSILHQIGATPPGGFMILGKEETWASFIQDVKNAEMVKSYVYLKVRLAFDPPATSFAQAAFEKQIDELTWRLSIMEFVFDPSAQPITSPQDNRLLAELDEQVDKLEDEIEDVPDLAAIFKAQQEG